MIIYHDLRRAPMFKPYFEASGVPHANHFRNKWIMLLCRILSKHTRFMRKIPMERIYSDPVLAPDDDKIIVFDTHARDRYINWLCLRHPDKRIILWFWNPIKEVDRFAHLKERVECWSYCKRDARAHETYCNTQFYFDCLAKEAESCPPPPADRPPKALFVGRDKGRGDKLEQLKNALTEAGVECDFRILKPPRIQRFASLFEKLIPYREVVDAVKQSQILIDYYTDTTAGLSLRAMEALFFGKKLITNRPLMRSEDFYDSRNIYILDQEERTLAEFLAEPCVPVDPEIRDRYLLSNWLKRFGEERPTDVRTLH